MIYEADVFVVGRFTDGSLLTVVDLVFVGVLGDVEGMRRTWFWNHFMDLRLSVTCDLCYKPARGTANRECNTHHEGTYCHSGKGCTAPHRVCQGG